VKNRVCRGWLTARHFVPCTGLERLGPRWVACPLWVISGHLRRNKQCPPRKQTYDPFKRTDEKITKISSVLRRYPRCGMELFAAFHHRRQPFHNVSICESERQQTQFKSYSIGPAPETLRRHWDPRYGESCDGNLSTARQSPRRYRSARQPPPPTR
jgi:hypothetical protein